MSPETERPIPVLERHRSRIDIEPTEEMQPIIIPEDTSYIETISLDRVPTVTQPSTKPTAFEIQIGFPQAPVTTSSVITETTTYTQVTTETFHDEDDIPKIVEGDSIHTTRVTVDKEDKKKPVEVIVQMPVKGPQDVTEVTRETRTITTEEIRAVPMEETESTTEVHTETIEIVPEEQKEVQFQVTIPSKEVHKTEITTGKERRPSAQKIEVEVHTTTMKQKPTEIIAKVVREVSGTEIEVTEIKDIPRPQDEQIEEIRQTIEKPHDEEIIPMEEVPEEGKHQEEEVIPMEEVPEEKKPQEEEIIPMKEVPEKKKHKEEEIIPMEEVPEEKKTIVEEKKHIVEEKTEITIPITEEIQEAVETVISKTTIEKKKPAVDKHFKDEISIEVKPEEKLPEEQRVEILLDIADQLTKEEKVEIVVPAPEEKEEVTETVVTEVKVDKREKHIEELTMNIMGDAMKEVQLVLPVKPVPEEKPEEQTTVEQVTIETVKEEFTFEVPETEDVQKEKTTLEIQEVPGEEFQNDIKMEQPEQEVPVVMEVSEVESVIETSSETVTLPESEQEVPQELTIQIDEKQQEEVSFSFEIDDTETTSVETTTTTEVTEETDTQVTFTTTDVEETQQQDITFEEVPTETTEIVIQTTKETEAPVAMETTGEEMTFTFQAQPSESVEFSMEMQPEKETTEQEITTFTEETGTENVETFELPVSQDTYTEEMTLNVEGRPSEAVEFSLEIQPEKETTEQEITTFTEETGTESVETVELPVSQDTYKEEMTLNVEGQPSESVEFSLQIQPEKETTEQEITTFTEETGTESFETFELPVSQDTYTEEMTLNIEGQPEEEFEMTLEFPDTEKQTTVINETTTTEVVGNIGDAFTFQLPESDESTIQISTIETEEKPQEEIEMTFELSDQEVPEVTETTVMDTTSESVTEEVTFELSEIEETDKVEVTLDIEDKPKLTLKMPSKEEDSVAKIVITQEETTETSEIIDKATTTQEIYDVEIPEGHSPPEFTWGLTTLKVMDGEEAKFRCELQGIPTCQVEWFHDDKPLYETQDFHLTFDTESGSCTLLIVEVFPQDAGEYRCEAVNPYGKAVTKGYLEVECKNKIGLCL